MLDKRQHPVGEEARGADGAAATRGLADLHDPAAVRDVHPASGSGGRHLVGAGGAAPSVDDDLYSVAFHHITNARSARNIPRSTGYSAKAAPLVDFDGTSAAPADDEVGGAVGGQRRPRSRVHTAAGTPGRGKSQDAVGRRDDGPSGPGAGRLSAQGTPRRAAGSGTRGLGAPSSDSL